MQLRDSLNSAVQELTATAVPSPRMNAELLLMFVLGCDRTHLFAHPERELTSDEKARYEMALAERARGVPAQYITGHQEFWGLDLIVTPAVLIPRPETEHVIETVLELARDHPLDSAPGRGAADFKIADVGTGSGCIALALAQELPRATIHAIDISREALEIARVNAARHQLESRIVFLEEDLLAGMISRSQRFDFVVSNPPYVGSSEEEEVQLEVRKFEPRAAVFAGASGLEVIERLVAQAGEALNSSGWLVMEIGYRQQEAVRGLLSDWSKVRFTADLQGIARVVAARR
jgi:release factor glutamine methyltransferase